MFYGNPRINNGDGVYNGGGGGGSFIGFEEKKSNPIDGLEVETIVNVDISQEWTRYAIDYRQGIDVQQYFAGGWPTDHPSAVSRPQMDAKGGLLYPEYTVLNYLQPKLVDGWRIPTTSDFINLCNAIGYGSAWINKCKKADSGLASNSWEGNGLCLDLHPNGYMGDWAQWTNSTTELHFWLDPTENKHCRISYDSKTVENNGTYILSRSAIQAYSIILCRDI